MTAPNPDAKPFDVTITLDETALAFYGLTGDDTQLRADVVERVEAVLAEQGLRLASGPIAVQTSGADPLAARVTGNALAGTTAEEAHLMLQATADEGWRNTEHSGELAEGDQVRVLHAPPGGHARIVCQGTYHAAYGIGENGGARIDLTPDTDGTHLDDSAKVNAMAWHDHVQWHKDEGHTADQSCRPIWELPAGATVQVRR